MTRSQPGQTTRFATLRARLYASLGLLVLAVLVQVTLLSRLRPLGVSPDLLVVMVSCWALLAGLTEGAAWAFFAGLGLDLVAGLPLGTSSLALLCACLPARLGINQMFGTNLLLPVTIVAAATVIDGVAMIVLSSLRGQPLSWLSFIVNIILPETALNIALVPLVYPLLRKFDARLGGRWMEW